MSEESTNRNNLEGEPHLRADFRRNRAVTILLAGGIGLAIGSYNDDLLNLLRVGYLQRPVDFLILIVASLYIVWWLWRNRPPKKKPNSSIRTDSDS